MEGLFQATLQQMRQTETKEMKHWLSKVLAIQAGSPEFDPGIHTKPGGVTGTQESSMDGAKTGGSLELLLAAQSCQRELQVQ